MKNLRWVVFALLISLVAACGENISINRLSIEVLNKHKEVTIGEQLKLDITVRDSEGIDYLLITIPVLGIEEQVDGYLEKEKWKLEKHFLVDNTDLTGTFEIFLTVVDRHGEEYIEVEEFTIK